MKGYSHYAGRCMFGGVMHVRRSFRRGVVRALDGFEAGGGGWFLDAVSGGGMCVARWGGFRPVGIQDTGCLLASDWSGVVPLCDVSAAAGPCIWESGFGRSEFVWRARGFTG